MTLERILCDIQSANHSGKTSVIYCSYFFFNKGTINALRKYGFNITLTTNRTTGKHWMRVVWKRICRGEQDG